jgi:hypothetical protein
MARSAASQAARERLSPQEQADKTLFDKDPWWAIEQGLVWTEDEHAAAGESARKQFPKDDYLRTIVEIYMKSDIGIVMKARQLKMTWLFCWLWLHEAITKPGSLCVLQGKREEDIVAKGTKGLMGRVKFMRRNLPPHLQPHILDEPSKSTEVYSHDFGMSSTLMAIPQGEDIIRSLTASRVFMDELAFHPNGERAWTAALPTVRGGGKLWGVTTPNGREFCYLQADDRLKWENWREWPMAMEGLYGYTNTNSVQLLALHYTADAAKRSYDYQDNLRRGYTNVKYYRQENELDFSVEAGDPVFPEFTRTSHLLKSRYVVNPMAPIYRGWDFGYNGQACVFLQHNSRGQLVWFDTVFFQGKALSLVCQEVIRRTLQHAGLAHEKGYMEVIPQPLRDLEGHPIDNIRLATPVIGGSGLLVFDYGDPAADAKNREGTTDRDTLSRFGMQLMTKPTQNRKRDIIEQVRDLLLLRSDGAPGLLVCEGPNVEQRYSVSGFEGGYHYPEKYQGRADKMLPQKDGFYDHIFDALQYCIDHVKPIRPGVAGDESGDGGWKATEWFDNPLQGGGDGDGVIR